MRYVLISFSVMFILLLSACSSSEKPSPVQDTRSNAWNAFAAMHERQQQRQNSSAGNQSNSENARGRLRDSLAKYERFFSSREGNSSTRRRSAPKSNSRVMVSYGHGYKGPKSYKNHVRLVAGLKAGTATVQSGSNGDYASGKYSEALNPDALLWALQQFDDNGDKIISFQEYRQNYDPLIASFK